MKIGFTGTRKGMTEPQKKNFGKLLKKYDISEFHHGDCIGSDEEAHEIADKLNCRIHIHPPLDRKHRAFCNPLATYSHPPKPYLERNHDIVNDTAILIAAPDSDKEKMRSGTWATIRYAKKKGKDVIVIYPNGLVEGE